LEATVVGLEIVFAISDKMQSANIQLGMCIFRNHDIPTRVNFLSRESLFVPKNSRHIIIEDSFGELACTSCTRESMHNFFMHMIIPTCGQELLTWCENELYSYVKDIYGIKYAYVQVCV
jgi:hypothetical protein